MTPISVSVSFVRSIVSVVLSTVAVDLAAATITVCPSGCDETTVREAVSTALPGDIVFVFPGIYVDPVSIDLDKEITLRGSGADQTVLRGWWSEPVLRIHEVPSGKGVVVEDLAIENGRAVGYGGGIEVLYGNSSGREILVKNCSIRSNHAPSGGGAIAAAEGPGLTLTIDSTEMHSNSSGSDGGAIFFWSSGSTLVVRDSKIVFNQTGSYGGGISVQHGSLVIESSEIRLNRNGYIGGGIVLYDAVAVINDSAIVDNESDSGGGIAAFSSDLSLFNSTIAMNSAEEGDGGGIRNEGTLDISFCTIANNRSSSGLGMGIENAGTAKLTASVLSNPGGDNCGGLFTSGGYNIDEDDTCGLSEVGDIGGVAAGLGEYVDTGDHRSHFKPRYDSVAIDHADVIVVPAGDQRGEMRPQDGDGNGEATCDSGAVERLRALFIDDFETGTTGAWAQVIP